MKTFVAQSLLLALAGMAMARSSHARAAQDLCSVDEIEHAKFEADWIENPRNISSSKGSDDVNCMCRDDDCETATCWAAEFHMGERLSCTQIGGKACGFFCDFTDYKLCAKNSGCHGFVTLPPPKKEDDDRSEM